MTPYREEETYAGAGPFTNLHPGGAGLPAHVTDNRSIENTELVVWHSFGVTHVPRPEDWPVMPVEYAGFMLMPTGFFDQSPRDRFRTFNLNIFCENCNVVNSFISLKPNCVLVIVNKIRFDNLSDSI